MGNVEVYEVDHPCTTNKGFDFQGIPMIGVLVTSRREILINRPGCADVHCLSVYRGKRCVRLNPDYHRTSGMQVDYIKSRNGGKIIDSILLNNIDELDKELSARSM